MSTVPPSAGHGALTSSVETDTGETGEHLVVNYFHWDAHKRELSAHLSLYKSKAAYDAGKRPMKPIVAKIRAHDSVFDEVFGHAQISDMLTKILNHGAANAGAVISDYSILGKAGGAAGSTS